jgi:uncharacterized protein (DUF4415 family)
MKRRQATSTKAERMAALAARTDEEIAAGVATDPDTYFPTDAELDAAVLVLPERKLPISLRVEPDVLAFYKSGGPGYQRRMNKALRAVMESELRRKAASGARRRA